MKLYLYPYSYLNGKSNILHSQVSLLKSKKEKINGFAISSKNYSYLYTEYKQIGVHWFWVNFYILWFEYFCSATWDQFFLLFWSLHSLKTQNISVSDPTWLSLSCPSCSLDFFFYNCGWSLFWFPDPHADSWVLLEPLFLGSRGIFLHCINQSACSLIHWSSYSRVAVNTSLPTVILGIINIWLLFGIVITMGKIKILSLFGTQY